jgi:ribosomal-protein-alanine N-acetyltransferase
MRESLEEDLRRITAGGSTSAPLRPSPGSALPPLGADRERFIPLRLEQIDDLMVLERRIYPFPWTSGNFADALRSGYSAWTLVSAADEILAYAVAMLGVEEAHLLNLAVDPARQRRGYGRRMLDWIAANMREYGARSLLLEVRPSNVEAQRLYGRYGFAPIGLRRGYYPAQGGREDAIVMRAAL